MREISSCSCLTFLPGLAWVLLSKICKDFFSALYVESCTVRTMLPVRGIHGSFHAFSFTLKFITRTKFSLCVALGAHSLCVVGWDGGGRTSRRQTSSVGRIVGTRNNAENWTPVVPSFLVPTLSETEMLLPQWNRRKPHSETILFALSRLRTLSRATQVAICDCGRQLKIRINEEAERR